MVCPAWVRRFSQNQIEVSNARARAESPISATKALACAHEVRRTPRKEKRRGPALQWFLPQGRELLLYAALRNDLHSLRRVQPLLLLFQHGRSHDDVDDEHYHPVPSADDHLSQSGPCLDSPVQRDANMVHAEPPSGCYHIHARQCYRHPTSHSLAKPLSGTVFVRTLIFGKKRRCGRHPALNIAKF